MIKPATSSGNLSLKKWEGNALWRVSPVSLSVFTLALSLQTFRLTYARVLDIRQKTCCFLAVHLEPVMSFTHVQYTQTDTIRQTHGPLVPMVGLVPIEKDVIPMVLLVNMHLIKGTLIIL